jgi:hypothetical protein
MILAAVKTNASNTGRTDVLGKPDYFVNKCSRIFYGAMSTYIFVEVVEFQPVGDL